MFQAKLSEPLAEGTDIALKDILTDSEGKYNTLLFHARYTDSFFRLA